MSPNTAHAKIIQLQKQSDSLRTEIRHLLIDLNLAGKGTNLYLARQLTGILGRHVSRNTVSMALSGFRSTSQYLSYLSIIKEYLIETQATAVLANTALNNIQEKKEVNDGQ